MKTHTSINQFVLSNFLETGGFLRWPGTSKTSWIVWEGIADQSDSENHDEFSVFNANFFLDKATFFKAKKYARLSSDELKSWIISELSRISNLNSQPQRNWIPADIESFQKSFKEIQSQIQAGTLQKALPVVFSRSPGLFSFAEQAKALLKLIELPTSLIPYGNWSHGHGFMGATPEILFMKEDSVLRTMALAGTAPLNRNESEFLTDKKERAEHQFVIENILQSMMGLGATQVSETKILKLPSLQHLMTEIEVRLNGQPAWPELIQRLHPTSALGTFPRHLWKTLKTLPEQSERFSFGAPFGVQLTPQSQVALVAIRQFQWDRDGIRIGAGCGLVKDSIFDREWQELKLKIFSVKRIFGWE